MGGRGARIVTGFGDASALPDLMPQLQQLDAQLSAAAAPAAPRAPAPQHGPGRAENTYTLIYGKKGQGKTTALRMMLQQRQQLGGSTTLVDPTGRNGDLGYVVRSPAGWWSHVRRELRAGRPFRVVLQPGRGVDLNALWAMAYEVGHALLAIDETQLFADAHRIDTELRETVSLGRNRQLDIATTVRTPPELHPIFRGNTDVVLSFAQPSRRYAEILAKEFYGDMRVADLLVKLPRFHYLRVQEGNISSGRLRVRF